MNSPVTRSRPAAKPAPARFYRADAFQAEESLGYLMRRAVASLSQSIERGLQAHDLTDAQWKPLFMMYQGRASTVAELARECMCDAGATTRMLDRLEAKGLLVRTRSSEDRRVVNIELTPEGRATASRIPQVLADALNEHLAGFSRDEWQTLKGLLKRVLDNGNGAKAQCPLGGQE